MNTSSSTPISMIYFIETRINEADETEYVVFARQREGRGLLDEMQVTEDPSGRGLILTFMAQDGTAEVMGDGGDLVPHEVLAQAQTENGLTIMYLDEKACLVGGQQVWGPADVSPKVAPTPSGR